MTISIGTSHFSLLSSQFVFWFGSQFDVRRSTFGHAQPFADATVVNSEIANLNTNRRENGEA